MGFSTEGTSRASQLRTSMGEGKGDRGGFGKGFGKGDGKGKGKKGNKGKRGGKKDDEKDWTPLTKLGRLVKDGKIKSLEQIYLFSLPIKEYQIIDFFLGPKLKEEGMKVMPVQKQTSAGQRTRFKAFVVMGDMDGHVGLGVKAAKEVATAMRGAIIDAKMNMVPVRRGYWGNKVGAPHTVPIKITAKCGSVRMRLIPAPKGTGIVAWLDQDDGQLCQGHILLHQEALWLPHPRLLEGHSLHAEPVPGVHRLPCAHPKGVSRLSVVPSVDRNNTPFSVEKKET